MAIKRGTPAYKKKVAQLQARIRAALKNYRRACRDRSGNNYGKTDAAWEKVERAEMALLLLRNQKDAPPKKGTFIAYKKIYYKTYNGVTGRAIATLRVYKNAARLCADQRDFKMRVSRARIVAIDNLPGFGGDTLPPNSKGYYSAFDISFKYSVGKIVKPRKRFDPNEHITCSSGIHCFMQRQRAVEY